VFLYVLDRNETGKKCEKRKSKIANLVELVCCSKQMFLIRRIDQL